MHQDRETALQWLQQGANLLTIIQDEVLPAEKGQLFVSFSGMWGQMGNVTAACLAAEKGLSLLPEYPSQAQLRGLINLGIISKIQGDFDKSVSYYEQSLSLAQKLHHPRLFVTASINLGIVLYRQGHFMQASDVLTAAMATASSSRTAGV